MKLQTRLIPALSKQLQAFRRPCLSRYISNTTSSQRSKTALFFPGQGTQKPGMLAPLIKTFPRTLNPLLDVLEATCPGLRKIIAGGPCVELTHTANAQPAILITSIAILRVLEKEFGLKTANFDYLLGHSLGEFSALVAADVISLEDALTLVRRRGEEMAACADATPGELGMWAIMVEPDLMDGLMRKFHDFIHSEVLPDDEFLGVANINSSTQIVLSGHVRAAQAFLCHMRKFKGSDPRAIRLNVSAPFHSHIMYPAVKVVKNLLDEMEIRPGFEKVVANATGRPYEGVEPMKRHLAAQAVETVQWKDSIGYLERVQGVERWVGIGPGKVGKNLVGREVQGGPPSVLCATGLDIKEMEEVVRALEDL
ncbi:acyl transferase/acyl hydrolase/lysophospholipase [Morchella snyderi]|nr:acyl transferase/acyl hydrolase/lysophospholipase [Morchella snyderi]